MTLALFSMMLPGLIYLIINNYIPMAGLVIAFKRFNYGKGIWGSDWAGLSNFTYLFKTQDAKNIIRNTIGYNLTFILLGNVLAVAVAVMLNFMRGTLNKKIYQTVILVPYLISMVVVSYIVFGFLSQENGFLNKILISLGKDPVSWYTTSKYWPFILVFVNLWKGFRIQQYPLLRNRDLELTLLFTRQPPWTVPTAGNRCGTLPFRDFEERSLQWCF